MRFAVGKLFQTISIAVVLMLAFAGGAFAQATGTINGRVHDQAAAVIPGATVTATNANNGISREAVTNGEGLYSFPGLEPGTYKISASLTGFSTVTRDAVALPVTATITIDLKIGRAHV